MKIICVSGGSYKSIYLNHLLKLRSCDLLIFNFGIIYDYDLRSNKNRNTLIISELSMLASRFKACVVAGVDVKTNHENFKGIIVCNDNNFNVYRAKNGVKINLCGKEFAICYANSFIKSKNKIVLSTKRLYPKANHCSTKKFILFCDRFGATIVQNQKIKRNFNKYLKIILK